MMKMKEDNLNVFNNSPKVFNNSPKVFNNSPKVFNNNISLNFDNNLKKNN
jgi:hypothetical protein